MFHHKKISTVFLAFFAAVMLSACGSESSDSADGMKYSGKASQAVIDAANANDLSSKALGIGFIDRSSDDLAPLNKSVEILAGPLAPGSSSAPVVGLVELLGEHGFDILEAFVPMAQGPIVPSVNSSSPFFKEDFPNIGGTFNDTLAETTEGPVTFYSGVLTFASAEHCTSKDGVTCTNKVNYDGSFSLTAGYLTSDIEGIPSLPEDWDTLGTMEKLSFLMAQNASVIELQAMTLTTEGSFSTAWTELSDGYGPVGPGEYSGYSTTRTLTYVMNGTAAKNDQNTDSKNEMGYGKEESNGNLTFTGDLRIDMALDSPEGTMALDFDATGTEVTMVFHRAWESPDSIEEGQTFSVTDTGNNLTLSIAGNATLAFTAETSADTLALDATLDGGRATFSLVSDAYTKTCYLADIATDCNSAPIVTRDKTNLHLTGEFAGAVDINAIYTTQLLTPVTQTLGIKLNAGLIAFEYKDLYHTEYVVNEQNVPDESGQQALNKYNSTITASFDGDITLTNGIEPITLIGDLDFAMVIGHTNNLLYPELNDDSTYGNLTLDELTIKATDIDTSLQGSFAFEVDEVDYRMRSDTPDTMLNIDMDLLLRNNVEGKTYWFNDYKLGIALDEVYREELVETYGTTISVSGRFHHPDYGYVDLSTGDAPFFINTNAIAMAGDMSDTALLLSALFPVEGKMTMIGSGGSQAVMEAINAYSPELYEFMPKGYTLSVDADGDGTFESGSVHTWPNLGELMENVWVLRLGMNIMEWIGFYGYRS